MSIERTLRGLATFFLIAVLAACGTLAQGQSPTTSPAPAETVELRFGAFIVNQSSQVDDVAENRRADAYYGETRRRFDNGEPGFTGWNGLVTVSVRTNGREVATHQAQVVNGFLRHSARVSVNHTTLVCVRRPSGIRVAHQKERPAHLAQGEHGVCTPQGQAQQHVLDGRRGHVLAFGIAARGQTARR